MAGRTLTDIVTNSFSDYALKRQAKDREREKNWTTDGDTLFGTVFVKRWSALKFTLTDDDLEAALRDHVYVASRGSCKIRYKTGVKTDEGHDILDSK